MEGYLGQGIQGNRRLVKERERERGERQQVTSPPTERGREARSWLEGDESGRYKGILE